MSDTPTVAQVAAMVMAQMITNDRLEGSDLAGTAEISWRAACVWHAAGVDCGEITSASASQDVLTAYCDVHCSHQPVIALATDDGCKTECATCAQAKGETGGGGE